VRLELDDVNPRFGQPELDREPSAAETTWRSSIFSTTTSVM
jgi:hypothetical protein